MIGELPRAVNAVSRSIEERVVGHVAGSPVLAGKAAAFQTHLDRAVSAGLVPVRTFHSLPDVAGKILHHLGLPATAPTLAPTRHVSGRLLSIRTRRRCSRRSSSVPSTSGATRMEAGTETIRWDGYDDLGLPMPQDAYLLRAEPSRVVQRGRVVRVR